MESDREEAGSHEDNKGNNPEEWGASFYRLMVMGDMLMSWPAKYAIPSFVIIIIPEHYDGADALLVGWVTLNSAILRVGLRLSIPKVIHKFLSFWGMAPTQLCSNG